MICSYFEGGDYMFLTKKSFRKILILVICYFSLGSIFIFASILFNSMKWYTKSRHPPKILWTTFLIKVTLELKMENAFLYNRQED